MIADTTFISDLLRDRRLNRRGPAEEFLRAQRTQHIRMSIITAGEIFVFFNDSAQAWAFLSHWTIYRLNLGIVETSAAIDRALIKGGRRLGENDNWIAGFAAYYREPLITRDQDFDRVPNLRTIRY